MDVLLSHNEFMNKMRNPPKEWAEQFRSAYPFPHLVLDDFFPADVLQLALDQFPSPNDLTWQQYNNPNELKLAYRNVDGLPSPIRQILYFYNSQTMLGFVEKITGITNLIADMSYTGGGLHQIERGGKLQVHLDFNKLQPWNLDRRLNLIVYLNQNWQEEYGGHLELWDGNKQACVHKILPVFNRCVIFRTDSETSWHGHPHPLNCPEGLTRKSLAVYYYTNGRPEEEKRPDHTTIFVGQKGASISMKDRAKHLVKSMTPPILFQGLKAIKKKTVG